MKRNTPVLLPAAHRGQTAVSRAGASQAILVLIRVLRLGEIDCNVGHSIPSIVDAGEQEQNRCDDECSVGNNRKGRVVQPVFQHQLIVSLTARPQYNDDVVRHPCETREAEQKASIPERLPRRAKNRRDEEHSAKMHDGWRGECSLRLIRPSIPNPRGQGHYHEHQACQRRRSGADDDVKVLPGGKRRHRSLLHDESPFDVYANGRRLMRLLVDALMQGSLESKRNTHTWYGSIVSGVSVFSSNVWTPFQRSAQ